MEVALYEPLIPQNTGNIGRLCVGMGVKLHLIEPLGFAIDDTKLKRAGLDYWHHLAFQQHVDFSAFYRNNRHKQIVCFSKHATTLLYDYRFIKNSLLLFGKETSGVPKRLLLEYNIPIVKLPMVGPIRSYNLANSTAMVLSEAYRQCYHHHQ